MRRIVRWRAVWAALGLAALCIVLLITLEPARDITHTALGWLRVEPLEIREEFQATEFTAQAAPAAATPSLADVVQVLSAEPSRTIPDAAAADIQALRFEVVTIEPPQAFAGRPTRSVTQFGTLTLQVDAADLAALLAPGFNSRALARRLGSDEVRIAGGALVITTWPADDETQGQLTLLQIEAPLVSGLPERDLALLTRLLSQALLPPILSRDIDVLELPLVQLALGLDVDPDLRQAQPTVTDLPTGDQGVTWMHARSQLLLTGPLAAESMLRLAAQARTER